MVKMLDRAIALASRTGDEKLMQYLQKEREKTLSALDALSTCSVNLYPTFQRELKKRTSRLETKIEKLNKSRDSLVSDNYLLEYKKKDLLLVTNKLEEAYEEISLKNRELMLQQQKIGEQAEKLNAIHEEIVAKTEELELQKEALLDQSDYLHEANETITRMHRDLEDQKNEILRKNEELLSLNNEKNNLIGIVAHDLKSPLNQIRGLLSIMKATAPDLSAETLSYIEMMETSSTRLSDMIAKILDVEAIEARQLNLVMEQTDIAEMLRSLVKRYALAAQEKGIEIRENIDKGRALVDRSYAEQVFENLLRDVRVLGCVFVHVLTATCHPVPSLPEWVRGSIKKRPGSQRYQLVSRRAVSARARRSATDLDNLT